METTVKTNLYNLLVTRDFEPEILDNSGRNVDSPEDAEMFSFDWKTPDNNYGTVVILLGTDQDLQVYYGDNLNRDMDSTDKSDWYAFLKQLKAFAARNLMTFDLKNLNRLKYTMQSMSAIKEGLHEGYYGNKKVSYSDQPKKTRLVIKHTRPLGEGEARYRYIESLFVETEEGERFKLPFTKLVGGRAMARHIAEGGTPYDEFGQHICEMVNDMNVLSRFVRAAKHKDYDDDAGRMVDEAIRHYSELKQKVKKIIGQRGYSEARSTFKPAASTDSDTQLENIRNMFIEQSLDSRIEEALPVLAKLSKGSEDTGMKEIKEFESWVENVVEGTWAVPDSTVEADQLKLLMSKPLPVGPDATNATEQLYDIIGDDQLFDELAALASQDPNADARPLVQARLKELGYDFDFSVEEDLDTDGVMMTRQSNMSSESIERLKYLSRL